MPESGSCGIGNLGIAKATMAVEESKEEDQKGEEAPASSS
jgi:hypothetical protein